MPNSLGRETVEDLLATDRAKPMRQLSAGKRRVRVRSLMSAATLIVAVGVLAACGSGNKQKQNTQSQAATSATPGSMVQAQPSTGPAGSSGMIQGKRLTPSDLNGSSSASSTSRPANSAQKRITPREMGSPSTNGG